ncbi:bifunctional MaoC family dehydratase N-terminal/OB-fold nucleic acid binding domain-containing protein [Streptomyces sp. NPDC058301]|uniref:bifunctional MaoC family dehydratase N-terminal/OB-fold nucleic acid binding domain-containing protein n=1 Tax=Streptomyces sp. NPDC058301 TaxID=3346436 RepID=UPI0036F14E23
MYGRLKAYEGRSAASEGVGKDLVNEPMIRHWCEAMGDTNPAYQGPDAIAPPTMLQAWTMGGLSGHADRSGAHDELFALLDGAGFTSVVATDCEQEYVRELRPGDRITYDAVIETVSERKTTKLGTGHFITTRMDVRANGELAGTHRFRILKYAPARRKPRGRRPRPVVNRDNAGFWDGVAAHKLLIQRCTGCGELRFPWLPGCNACGAAEWDTVEASGAGTVFSYVVMHHPRFPGFAMPDATDAGGDSGPGTGTDPATGTGPTGTGPAPDPSPSPGPGTGADPGAGTAPDGDGSGPYAVGLIELAEGVRVISNVVGVPYDKVRIGMPVRLEFLRVDEELELPVFRGGEGG